MHGVGLIHCYPREVRVFRSESSGSYTFVSSSPWCWPFIAAIVLLSTPLLEESEYQVSDYVSAVAPPQIIDVAQKGLKGKASKGLGTIFISAMFAGAMIALGFVFFTTVNTGMGDVPFGIKKLLGGFVFSCGLGMVVLTGADLFTSTTMTTLLAVENKLSPSRLLTHWLVVYCGNFVGALLVVFGLYGAGTAQQADGAWGAVIVSTATAKVNHGWFEALLLGIFCNVMVCLAVWLSFAGRSLTDKIVAVTLPIALFVGSGFEHSVANMFMIPFGLLLKAQGNPDVIAATNGLDLSNLTMGGFLWDNLLPVTIGNIIGGSIVALGMLAMNPNRPSLKAEKEAAK